MYFKNIAEKIGEFPDYITEYMNKYHAEVAEKAKPDIRRIMGSKTCVVALRDASQELRDRVEFTQYYVMSQQLPILREKIPYERSVMVVRDLQDSTGIPNRYLNRVGEMIVVVIAGSVTMSCPEFEHTVTLNSGEYWRLNPRIPLEYRYTPDFYAIVLYYLDFDLAHYCMPFDLYGTMPRRRDEFLDYDPANDEHRVDNFSTNEY